MNILSIVKTIIELSIIRTLRVTYRWKDMSSFLPNLGDCPVGGSSVGGRLSAILKNESRVDCFIPDFCTVQNCALKVSLK